MEEKSVDCHTAVMQKKNNEATEEKRGYGVAREYIREALHDGNGTRPRERVLRIMRLIVFIVCKKRNGYTLTASGTSKRGGNQAS